MDALGAAGHGVKADEVAALGAVPGAGTGAAQVALQHGQHHIELGLQQLGVLLHVIFDTSHILEIDHVAQLVDLVGADGLDSHDLLGPLNVQGRSGHGAHAGAGIGDLGGGAELQNAVLGAVFLGQLKDVQQLVLVVGQMMDDVGVVPENTEIGGSGLHAGKAADHFVRIGLAFGIGVLGHAPDTLNGGILGGQFFHHIHVGAVGQHGNGDHLHAQLLADGEVTVIAGCGAQPLDLLLLAPGGAVGSAKDPQAHHGVVHHGQAGIAAGHHPLHGHFQQIGKQLAAGQDALQAAVVAGIGLAVHQVGVLGQDGQHIFAQIQLSLAGLAAGHIQLQALGLAGLKLGQQFLVQSLQRGAVSGHQIHWYYSLSSPYNAAPIAVQNSECSGTV